MYSAPPLNRSFHYFSTYHQSLENSIPQNSNVLSKVQFQDKQITLSLKDNSNTKNISNFLIKTETISKEQPVNSFTTHYGIQDRLLNRQSNLETSPVKRIVSFINSQSHSNLHDRIQRERRAHTMAPLSKISGPSATPLAKMFATTYGPIDNQINTSHNFTQKIAKISYGKSDTETTDIDAPIIVKVRYDPRTNILPTEDAIRKALGHQIFDRKKRKDPIVVNFLEQNKQPHVPNRLPQNPFPSRMVLQPSYILPSVSRPPHILLHNKNNHPIQIPKLFTHQQQIQSLQKLRLPPNQNLSSARTNRVYPKELNNSKPISRVMATQQSSSNNQQILSNRPNLVPSSGEVFRPSAVKDIPELSRENLLNMLNKIPDLQGRQFNIEYAPSSAPEGYPIPSNINTTNNAYPEPVVIDRLPTNVIQHVKSSDNPALTAAFEATMQREQHVQSQSLNAQSSTVVHHSAQPYQQVQQSRPESSNESTSSTEVSSSSETSSSEETDIEESKHVSTTNTRNNLSFVGPIPPTSFFQNQHR